MKLNNNSLCFNLKSSLFFLFIVISISGLKAQSITNYTFATNTLNTYTALTTPTVPTLSAGTVDDGYYNSLPIGFDFWYMGTRYTTISASTNGWITLGANITNSLYTNSLANGGAPRPVIAPLWDDLDMQVAGNVTYKTTGTAGARIFTIQYANAQWDYSAAGNTMSFQVKLYEGTGQIVFHYDQGAGAVNAGSASIGITAAATGSGNFYSVNGTTVSSTVETSTISVKPSVNRIYSFTPAVPGTPTNLTFTNVQTDKMTLNWTDNSSNETGFVIYRSTDNVTFTYATQVAAGITSSLQEALALNTTYYWRIYAVSEGRLSTALNGSRATACIGPVISQMPTAGLIANYKFIGDANDETNTNQGTFQNNPTPTSDRFGNSNQAYYFNGSSQYMSTAVSYNNPSNFSLCLWFKTTTTRGGRLIGFGTTQTGASGSRDRMVWMKNDGKLIFAVNPGYVGYTLTTNLAYNDGNWHQLIATCSNTPGQGINLYMDGVLVGTNTAALGGENYTGYWRVNYDEIGWGGSPSSNYFNGAMDDILIYNRAITPSEVTTIFTRPDGAGSNSPVCEGGTLNLTAPTIANVTYAWTGPNGFSSSLQNPTVTSMTEAKEGTYTLTVKNTSGCAAVTTAHAVGKIKKSLGPTISQIPTPDLLFQYKFDGNANDASMLNHGTLQNSPGATDDRFGISNSAYAFNGSSQYVSTSLSYANPSNFTMSVWFKTETVLGGTLVSFGTAPTGFSGQHDRVLYMNNAGKIIFGVYPGSVQTISSTYTYNDGNWHQATASLSSTNGMKLYVDGLLVANNASVTSAENYTGFWKFGYDALGGWTSPPSSDYFNGSIDDILMYNRELTSAQVAAIYGSPDGAGSNSPVCENGTLNLTATTLGSTTYLWSGPTIAIVSQNPSVSNMSTLKEGTYTLKATSAGCISYAYTIGKINYNLGPAISQIPTTNLQSRYKLDGNANDNENRNHGRLQNSPTPTSDRFGNANSAYMLNGTSQYITTSASYNNPTNTTLSLWFKTTTNQGGKIIGFSNGQTGGSGSYDRHLYMGNSGQLYFGVNPASGMSIISTTAAYNDGVWHHVVATTSASAGTKLFVDGALISSDPVPSGGQVITSGYWRIGYDNLNGWPNVPTSLYFAGSIDDVLIYSGTALSAANVAVLYNSPDGASSDGPVCPGSTLNLTGPAVNGATYSWTGPGSFSATGQNTSTIYLAAYNGSAYTVAVTANGCTSKAYVLATSNTTTPGRWTGTTNNNWGTIGNWCNSSLPTSTTNVVIPGTAPQMPSISSSVNSQNLTIDPDATLTITSGGTLNIYGNFTNNGAYTSSGSTIFRGSSAQTSTGATTFYNLTVNNSAGVSLNSATTINGVLTLTSGTLNSGGNLTVDLTTGAIAGTGTGSISGNITTNKTITSSRYHYISSPLSGRTVQDWADDLTINIGQYANLYTYNETNPDTVRATGWEGIKTLDDPLSEMKGFALFFNSPTTIDQTGSYTHNASYISPVLTNTISSNNGVTRPGSDGWHLIGNPYPSALDWNAASGWTKTGLDNAVYFWDPANNRYASYVGVVGTNGGTQYIPSMQGFWVKVNTAGGTGSLAMNKNVRVTSTNPATWRLGSNANILRLKVNNGSYSDETVVRFADDAEETFDSGADAYKMKNEGNTPSLYTMMGKDEYSINSLPLNFTDKTVPLKIEAGFTGTYTITAEELESFGSEDLIIFEDKLLGVKQDLKLNPIYTAEVNKADTAGRFYLNFKRSEVNGLEDLKTSFVKIWSDQERINILFNHASSGQAVVSVSNITGQEVFSDYTMMIANQVVSLDSNYGTGIYLVKVIYNGTIYTEKVAIFK